ncbi:MAG: hypothetical protein QOG80_1813 [Pseudonocardiales bacterium]|jgi:hypothetical protein|nr:hypothetical protein [Pseudonocardiales bacterium]
MSGCLRLGTTTVLAALVLSGCVGPARTSTTYEAKAVRAANDSLSALQTALLTVETAERGRLTQPYLEIMLSKAEDALSSIQNTFDTIQPPNAERADRLHGSLDKLLSDGSDGLAQLRILARRHERAKLAAEAKQLVATAHGLDQFATSHG